MLAEVGARKTNVYQEYVPVPVKTSHSSSIVKGVQENNLLTQSRLVTVVSKFVLGAQCPLLMRGSHGPSYFCTKQTGKVNGDIIGDPTIFQVFSGGICLLNSLEKWYLILVHSQ